MNGLRFAAASRSSSAKSRRCGWTLTETLIAVSVMGILATIAIPAATARSTQKLDATVLMIAADLARIRGAAIRYNTKYRAEFRANTNSYLLTHVGTGTPPALPAPLRAGPQTTAQDAAGVETVSIATLGNGRQADNGVRLVAVLTLPSQAATTTVTFGPQGGTGPERTEHTIIWLSHGSGTNMRYARLTINWVTGQVWSDRPGQFSMTSYFDAN